MSESDNKRLIKNAELIDRIKLFDDSKELSDALSIISGSVPSTDSYYLKECQVHILGLYDLAVNLGKALEASNDTARKG